MVTRQSSLRRRGFVSLLIVVPMLAIAITAGGLLGTSVSAQEATPTAAPGVLDSEPANVDCSMAPVPTTDYAIVSEESAVRYRAQEELRGVGATEAVGETNAFIGNIYFDEAGLPLVCSRWDADLRQLTSDESRRDNYLYNNTLETETYPLATFILTSVEGLDQPLGSEDVTFTLIGDLTLHGVTKAISWTATAKIEGETLTGSAQTTFDMEDFNITPPTVGPVISLEETVVLEADITAELVTS